MATHPLAGKPAPPESLVDVAELQRAYYDREPDPENAMELVSFGTSGHRGSALDSSFNQKHVLAMTQAVCDYRRANEIDGPLFLGKDPHALSACGERDTLEVLAANGVETVIQEGDGFTPTPVISWWILEHNRGRRDHLADGIVMTPSHNPPRDGGFKYNPPNAGPAETDVTGWIQARSNELIRGGNREVKRTPFDRAIRADTTHARDLAEPYIRELGSVIDTDSIKSSRVRIGVDPLGGAAVAYWERIAGVHGFDITVVNPRVDPAFSFMTLDHDGKIRMDCSSPYAMASLVGLKEDFDIAFGNDPDVDRHGIVARSSGLLNPNHYLAVAINYLLKQRPEWPTGCAVGKTLVSSSLIDRVVADLDRRLIEVPVGFKWFVSGLLDGSTCVCGEESAGATFLRRDGTVWTTEKDGIILGLLAAEILAQSGRDPGEHYRELEERYGTSHYQRIDAPATQAQKEAFKKLSVSDVTATTLAGEPILARLTHAPGNNAPIGGLKVVTASGWFAARPSGTENIFKLYAESFKSRAHLDQIFADARQIIDVKR